MTKRSRLHNAQSSDMIFDPPYFVLSQVGSWCSGRERGNVTRSSARGHALPPRSLDSPRTVRSRSAGVPRLYLSTGRPRIAVTSDTVVVLARPRSTWTCPPPLQTPQQLPREPRVAHPPLVVYPLANASQAAPFGPRMASATTCTARAPVTKVTC